MLKHFFFRSFVICHLTFVIFLSGCGGDPTVSSIVISPATPSIGINKTQQFTAAAYDSAGTQITATFTWSVNGSLGTIDSNGLFTAGGTTGTIVIQAASGGITGSTTASLVSTGSIAGTITNSSGNKISGIAVFLTSTPTFWATSSGGNYTISGVPAGSWEVRKAGTDIYLSTTKEVTVATGEAANGGIVLGDRFSVQSDSVNLSSATGTAINNGTTEATGVIITYSCLNALGQPSGSGYSSIGTMSPGQAKSFSVLFNPPATDQTIVTRTFAATTY
ncbi:hypothetical protein A2438_05790 [candidate division WOR-1 bacterium RIFOXYC2_FULL_46_14]|uniref:BIG2 domain-containing protein n=1 Tax=candidate division WOR-1 bacterium RIFOXYC2_FULL_46_14 TaxID=1802587 RepID=A0A1F4U4W8_UNCSA|nr:MAG: hypothetical protein A2438_05790 [candidate division WOR-1 bacterium RIFOXYC2_FULL_46_14]